MTPHPPIRVLIVDDHLMVRDGLQVFLSVYEDIDVVGGAKDGQEALDLCVSLDPDVVLMDLVMPNMDGPEATRLIRAAYPSIQVVALTSFAEKDLVLRAIQAGAIGYVLKDVHADELAETIREAHHGHGTLDTTAAQALMEPAPPAPDLGNDLTPRELEILALMVQGKANKEIASDFSISIGTVRFHISNILSKLGAGNRTEAVSLALQHDLI